ncbi:MAG: hypothetical protein ABI353_18170 [Isosphaeraceae bacterium]
MSEPATVTERRLALAASITRQAIRRYQAEAAASNDACHLYEIARPHFDPAKSYELDCAFERWVNLANQARDDAEARLIACIQAWDDRPDPPPGEVPPRGVEFDGRLYLATGRPRGDNDRLIVVATDSVVNTLDPPFRK